MNLPIIYASGKGTRMSEITKEIPKPLVEVEKGKSLIEYNLEFLIGLGFKKVAINFSYREDLFKALQNKYANAIEIILLEDDPPSGHGGLLMKHKSTFRNYDNLFAMNGDSIFNFDYEKFLSFHLHKKSSFSILSSDKTDSPKVLICDPKTSELLGIKSTSLYFYSQVPSEVTDLKNNLGSYLIKVSDIYSIPPIDENFSGFFGQDDLAERLYKKGFKSFCIEMESKIWRSANTVQELEEIKRNY